MRRFLLASSLLLLCNCDPSTSTTPTPATDGGADAPASTCVAPAGPGIKHNDAIAADTTWRAADGPHFVTFGFNVEKGATLTIEPCAEVRFQGDYGITVKGNLVADGTPTEPIHFLADNPSTPWSYIELSKGTASFRYVTLENGGNAADPNGLGIFDVRGDTSAANRQELLRLDHVTLKTSDQYGISLRDNATLTADSDAVTITGAKLGPIRTFPELAGTIPAGSYTGNGLDEIVVVAGPNNVGEDTTWHARGVPYRVGEPVTKNGKEVRVGLTSTGAPLVTLTIEAGVTVKMTPTGGIMTSTSGSSTSGAISAVGTASAPIVFTSAAPTPAAGDWEALRFGGPSAKNKLDFVHVDYAGGPSQAKSYHCDLQGTLNEAEDSSILIFGEPPTAFVTNSTISNSAGYGIGRAWSGALVDFIPTNTFTAVAKCKQSYPRDINGGCPSTVACQ